MAKMILVKTTTNTNIFIIIIHRISQPKRGLAPPTYRLQGDCSSIELLRLLYSNKFLVHPTGIEPVSRPNLGLTRYKLAALPLCYGCTKNST